MWYFDIILNKENDELEFKQIDREDNEYVEWSEHQHITHRKDSGSIKVNKNDIEE